MRIRMNIIDINFDVVIPEMFNDEFYHWHSKFIMYGNASNFAASWYLITYSTRLAKMHSDFHLLL